MDPKVYGKLLMLHRRGNGVDVEALRDRIPSGRSSEKAPRWDLTRTEACSGGKVFWWTPLMVWEYFRIYRAEMEVGGLRRQKSIFVEAFGGLGLFVYL